jgi:hypothetical protein
MWRFWQQLRTLFASLHREVDGQDEPQPADWVRAKDFRTFFKRVAVSYPASSLISSFEVASSAQLEAVLVASQISLAQKRWLAESFPALHELVADIGCDALPGCVTALIWEVIDRVKAVETRVSCVMCMRSMLAAVQSIRRTMADSLQHGHGGSKVLLIVTGSTSTQVTTSQRPLHTASNTG